MPLERFSAAWREQYVTSTATQEAEESGRSGECVFCTLARAPVDESTGVLWRGGGVYVALNAYPYGSGHLLVLPERHVASLGALEEAEYLALFLAIRDTVAALDKAYGADGMNVGLNLGQAAGAGIPQHLHSHVLPRWSGDTNFMTTIGETRVLPESLVSTWRKIHPFFGT